MSQIYKQQTGSGPTPPNYTISGSANPEVLVPPVAGTNNWEFVGQGNITCTGNAALGTMTISDQNLWVDQGTSITVVKGTNYFAIASITLTMPSAPSQGDTTIIFVDTSGPVTIACTGTQRIRLSQGISSTAGSQTSSFQGDSVTLVYRAATAVWQATSFVGTWQPA